MRYFLLLVLPLVLGCGDYIILEHYEESLKVGDRPEFVVEMVNGSIKIQTIPGKEMNFHLTKRGVGNDKDEAERALQAMDFDFLPDGNKIVIKAKRLDDSKHWGNSGMEISLQVPSAARLELKTSNDQILVEGVTGDIVAQNSNGRIKVGKVAGSVQLITTNAGVSVENVTESAKIETTHGSITTRGARPLLYCKTKNGHIRHTGGVASGKSQLINSNGSITVSLPVESKLSLEASTSNGRVKNDFNLKSGAKTSLKGCIGNSDSGAFLFLKNSNGNIDIKKNKNGKDVEEVEF